MIKKIIFLLVVVLICDTTLFAQLVFVRQNVTTYTYNNLHAALQDAQDGDTIYLPGCNYQIGTLQINKSLKIFGAGHFPDSTTATFPTILNGNIHFLSDGSNSLLTGVQINGDIFFGTNQTNNNATQIEIRRCRVNSIILNYSTYHNNSNVSFVLIKENYIMGSVYGMGAQHVMIEQNLINGAVRFFLNGNAVTKNNTFLGGEGCPAFQFSDLYNCLIQNNIIMNSGACSPQPIAYGVSSCIFDHNVFNVNYNFPFGSNTGIANYVNVPFNGFFVNETDYTIDYQNNYHLQNPTAYLGSDGTQVGIYGTNSPFKDGSLPTNPHIISKNIAPQTDVNGYLQIQITVNAQNN